MAEPSKDLSQEHLAAIGEAGTVYLSGTWSGFVNFPLPDGTTAWSDQIDTSFSCTGFVASSDGYVVTAGHCADVAEGKTALIDQFLANEVQNGDITEADAEGYIAAGAEEAWPVEGQKTGEQPVLAMKVYPAISISNDDASSFTAVLQDDRPLSQGDVALFKIDAPAPLPVLVVSDQQPATGQQIDAIGYPGNVTDLVSGNPQPTFAQGQVSGRQQTDGGPFTQIGVTMSPGMSGGPVIDGKGDVVGTISFGPSGDTQQLNFAAAPETITGLLARNGVKNDLSDADVLFRTGLAEYFDGKYHASADHLGKALAANPANAIAQQYQSKAIAAYPQENTTGWLLWVLLGGGVVLLLIVGLVILLLVRAAGKRRRAAAAIAGVAVAPGVAAPVSGASGVAASGVATPAYGAPSAPAAGAAAPASGAPGAAAAGAPAATVLAAGAAASAGTSLPPAPVAPDASASAAAPAAALGADGGAAQLAAGSGVPAGAPARTLVAAPFAAGLVEPNGAVPVVPGAAAPVVPSADAPIVPGPTAPPLPAPLAPASSAPFTTAATPADVVSATPQHTDTAAGLDAAGLADSHPEAPPQP